MLKRGSLLIAGLSLYSSVWALDKACEPLIEASKARMQQPAWHSIVDSDGFKLEALKVDGKFYMKQGDKWRKSPIDLDQAELTSIDSMLDGRLKISNCKDEGSATVAGIETRILGYDTAVDGSDLSKGRVKLYIGKKDGLPYQSTFTDTQSTYRYTQIKAPTL